MSSEATIRSKFSEMVTPSSGPFIGKVYTNKHKMSESILPELGKQEKTYSN